MQLTWTAIGGGWQSYCSDEDMLDETLTPIPISLEAAVTAGIALPQGPARSKDGRKKADTTVEKLLDNGELPLVVIIGADAFDLLEALEHRSPGTKVLLVEPDATAAERLRARRTIGDRIADGRLIVLSGPDYAGAADAFRFFPKGVLAPPVLLAPGASQRVGADALAAAKTTVGRIITGVRANNEARRQFAGRYLLNTLRNLPVISSEGDVAKLTDAFAGMPAIVVGAGPALDRNLEQLKALQHRALIISVDTACRPLIAAGINPHLVVAVDPTHINAQHLLGLPDTRGIWFVGEGSIDGEVFPQFAQRTFTFRVSDHHPWPLLAANGGDRGTLQAWGSVLTTAFDLAVHVGCNPIAFAGADLAYTNGLRYCRNTIHEWQWRDYPTDEARAEQFRPTLETRPHLTEKDIRGNETISTPPFLQFRDWIRSRSQAVNRQVINATGSGVLHGGAIKQRPISKLKFPERVDHQSDVQRRLYNAWMRGAEARAEAQHATSRALAYGSAVPLDAWFDFGGDTTTMRQITEAAQAAGRAVDEGLRTQRYLAGLRDFWDNQVTSIESARNASHGHFDIAARRAASQQTVTLMDFLQRTYSGAGQGLRASLGAASVLPDGLRALDVGCGVGRQMVPLAEAGIRVDGVDISQRMLDVARGDERLAESQFFVSSGQDCGAAPDGAYDLVYSQLLFRYVCSRTVRRALLRAMARALRPGGVVFVEMRLFHKAAVAVAPPHVPWSMDWMGDIPAGHSDVELTPDQLHMVFEDFSVWFNDLRLQIVDPPVESRHRLPPQLLVSGAVNGSLTTRMHAFPVTQAADAQ